MTSHLQQSLITLLPDQEFFEALLLKRKDDRIIVVPPNVIVYFTASWCGPCKKLDVPKLFAFAAMMGVAMYKSDIDENTYTHGYCGVNSIPGFISIQRGIVSGKLTESNTDKVLEWIVKTFSKTN